MEIQKKETPEQGKAFRLCNGVSLELSPNLSDEIIIKDKEEFMLTEITNIRNKLFLDMGICVPFINITDNINLPYDGYLININGTEFARDIITENTDSFDTRSKQMVLLRDLEEVLELNIHVFITREILFSMLSEVKKTNSSIIDEILLEKKIPIGDIQNILKNLLKERVSIHDMVTILETISDNWFNFEGESEKLVMIGEKVRYALRYQICSKYIDKDNALKVITIDADFLTKLTESKAEYDKKINLDKFTNYKFELLHAIYKEIRELYFLPVLLCTANTRILIKNIFERTLPYLPTISEEELAPCAKNVYLIKEVLKESNEEKLKKLSEKLETYRESMENIILKSF